MPSSGLVVSTVRDVTVVSFQNASILDSVTIDAAKAELYALIDEQDKKKVILDFRNVEFLSSQMIGVLVTLHKKAVANRSVVVVSGMRTELKKVFKIMNLLKVLNFADTEEDALSRVGAAG